jgi:primosomal protein N' (replication factor Y)
VSAVRLVHVAVPVPALDSLTYSLPETAPQPPPGARVLVPLGSRVLTGCVVDRENGHAPSSVDGRGKLKDVIEVLDREPFLPEDVVRLATWVAEYYASGLGEALAAAMPPLASATSVERAAAAFRTVRVAHLSAQGHESHAVKLGARQQEAIALLQGAPDGIETSELASKGIAPATIKRLASMGLVTIARKRVERDPFQAAAADSSEAPALVLTDDQQSALERLRGLFEKGSFHTAVLHGVTGSGKTEIYLRLAAEVRHGPRCSRRCDRWASSSSTKSTMARTSRRRARATTAATSR